MKRILSLLKPQVIRAIIYSSISKAVIAICVLLLWHNFLNKDSLQPWGIVDTGFFALSVWFILCAWFSYLSFDGLRPFRPIQSKKENNSSQKFSLSNLFGFKNHLIEAMDENELEEDEAAAAKICSNLLLALIFFVPSLISMILS